MYEMRTAVVVLVFVHHSHTVKVNFHLNIIENSNVIGPRLPLIPLYIATLYSMFHSILLLLLLYSHSVLNTFSVDLLDMSSKVGTLNTFVYTHLSPKVEN